MVEGLSNSLNPEGAVGIDVPKVIRGISSTFSGLFFTGTILVVARQMIR